MKINFFLEFALNNSWALQLFYLHLFSQGLPRLQILLRNNPKICSRFFSTSSCPISPVVISGYPLEIRAKFLPRKSWKVYSTVCEKLFKKFSKKPYKNSSRSSSANFACYSLISYHVDFWGYSSSVYLRKFDKGLFQEIKAHYEFLNKKGSLLNIFKKYLSISSRDYSCYFKTFF